MAVAPGRNEHVAGYLQRTARYSSRYCSASQRHEEKTAVISSFFFRTCLQFGPESLVVFCFTKKATWRIRLLADS